MDNEQLRIQFEELCDELLNEKFDCLKNELVLVNLSFINNNELIKDITAVFINFHIKIDRVLKIARKYSYCLEGELSPEDLKLVSKRLESILNVSLDLIYSYSSLTKYLEFAINNKNLNGIESVLISSQFNFQYSQRDYIKDLEIIKKIS